MASIEQQRNPLDQQLTESDYLRLLGEYNDSFSAQSRVERGPNNGTLDTYKRQIDGDLDGVDYYRPGMDDINDLDIRSSLANQVAISRKRQGQARPQEVHVIVETGRRLSIGDVSLRGLSRLAVASSVILANETSIPFHAIYSSGNTTKKLGYNNQQSPSPRQAISSFDKFAQAALSAPADADGGLDKPLKFLNSDQSEMDSDNAIVVIASDFINGAQRDKKGKLVKFSWEASLESLNHQLKDRLKIFRLNTPSFTKMPLSNRFSDGKRVVDLELGDYLNLAAKANEKGQEKQDRIDHILAHWNVAELNTTDSNELIIKKTNALLNDSKR